MSLKEKKCVPCEGGVPKLTEREVAGLLPQLAGWEASDDRLSKRYTFADFAGAMGFVNDVAGVAEGEGHHPDFCVHYNRVDVAIWTHAIGGLSENDFILAAKIDAIDGGAGDVA